MRLGPNDTQPIDPASVREYGIPSCTACLNMASRRGFKIGQKIGDATIEGFSHNAEGVMILASTEQGFIEIIPL